MPTLLSRRSRTQGSTASASLKSSFSPTRLPALTARNTRLKNWSNVKSLSTAGGWHMITSRAVSAPVLDPAAFHRAAALDERVDAPRIMRSASIMWHDLSASATSNASELFTPCAQQTFRGSMHPKCVPRLCAIAPGTCAQPAVMSAPRCQSEMLCGFGAVDKFLMSDFPLPERKKHSAIYGVRLRGAARRRRVTRRRRTALCTRRSRPTTARPRPV
mmetsp:Transcript_15783/g.66526  ORF Transcript_15783/g.66526 Transcript_15783/m.66526 type:complete len:217 (-) Transcript_15783:47-697(-)